MICINCHKKTESIKSVITHGKVVTGCSNCLPTLISEAPTAANHRREAMKREYAADLVQPIEKDFAKRYGADKAREVGWSEASIRKYT